VADTDNNLLFLTFNILSFNDTLSVHTIIDQKWSRCKGRLVHLPHRCNEEGNINFLIYDLNYALLISYSHTSKPAWVGLRIVKYSFYRLQWSRGLRRRSAAAWLLGSRVRILLRDGCLSAVFICCVFLCR
jgi:hypothetical protein